MMKRIILLALLFASVGAFAQSAKKTPPPKKTFEPWQLKLNIPQKAGVPPAENPFGLPVVKRTPLPAFIPQQSGTTAPNIKVTRGENGLPILFEGQTGASGETADPKVDALNYLASLQPAGITEPLLEFAATSVETDEQGNLHVRLEQQYRGIPVFGGEVIAHTRGGKFALLNGRYFPTPQLNDMTPALDAGRAIDQVKQDIGPDNIKANWTADELHLFKAERFTAELIVYHHEDQLNNERLAWRVQARPNLLRRLIYFVDAKTGEIIHHYDFTCAIDGGRHETAGSGSNIEYPTDANCQPPTATANFLPPVTGTGVDLLGVSRSFGAWQNGSNFYLEDAGKMMFNSTASTMPGDPVGVIVTLDALSTSPENQSFNYTVFTSGSSNFSNSSGSNGAKAVSAHYNSILSYDYFQNIHGRKSIDGEGGNILAFVNVTEGNGSSMENAFWNGDAMWYGNGGSVFKPLARGLDVGGHEMTHGVIEKTANLIYQGESGALNESFADVFGVMIDPNDWKVGEDVMQNGVSPNGCLRSLQDPHNGDVPNGQWWQPKHVNEKYNGSQDNGGVHINSGIPNHAFYLFATNAAVGNAKAEKVYYKALRDYLVKSSKFVDCRIAVIQAASDLYGNAVANAAASAFDQVGILGSSPGGNYLGQLQVNSGDDYILCVSNNGQNLDIAFGNQVLGSIYTQGLLSRPSVTDNGSQIVFVNAQGHIITVDMVYTPTDVLPTVNQPLSASPIWRSAAISKDGRYVAALTNNDDNLIYVFDLLFGDQEAFELYNPTYSTGQVTGEVQFADVLEFDYSGTYIMYDAFNQLSNSQGQDISYWDIGFLQFWENGGFANGTNAFISKLFSGLPEKTTVGNPTFSKNSPYIVAFDQYDEFSNKNDIYGANVETGDYSPILENNGDYGWPNYNRLDNALIYHGPNSSNITNIYTRGLAANKISPSGNESLFISNRQLGVWYADGNRSLMVDTEEPSNGGFVHISLAPNPVTDAARLSVNVPASMEARVSIVNMLGQTVQHRNVQLTEGDNTIGLDMQQLAPGTYVVRLLAGNSGTALKIVKQ